MKAFPRSLLFLVAVFFLITSTSSQPANIADLALINGRIWTGNEAAPWAEAIAIKGNKILRVGKYAAINPLLTKETKVIDLGGRLAVPGFNDAHTHFLGGSLDLLEVNLTGARSLELMQTRVVEYARQHPNELWITGAGWEYSYFPGQRLPTRADLDAVVKDRPVYLRAYDGHTGWCNSKALELAGVTRDTKFAGFGEIVRDQNGEPTGVLKEGAQSLVRRLVPNPSKEKKLDALRQGMRLAASLGITSIQNASGSADDVGLYQELLERGDLTLRVSVAFSMGRGNLPDATLQQMIALKDQYRGNAMLRAAAVKFVLDGVIESHTAAMLEPYSDEANHRGEPSYPVELYNDLVKRCSRAGFQIYTHAIGDRAVRLALDAYEAVRQGLANPDLRSRIEHIEVIAPTDIPRFAKLGVLASMEPIHADPDTIAVWSRAVGTERVKRAFAWNELRKHGARLVFSSDWPATISVDPIRGLHNAVNRRTIEGKPPGGWIPEQRITIEQALRAYTSAGAYASFEETMKGTLAPGMLADIVVISQDLFKIDPLKIHETRVVITVFDGKVVYRNAERFPASK
ncbi:MAG TPA: amidohydrolase [Blastocatellia bacterium]|nr:amidohydrolase [Blastocatellia bacterium]